MKRTARFLNAPKMVPIPGNEPFAISTEPLLFQFAGDPVPQSKVDDFLDYWGYWTPGQTRADDWLRLCTEWHFSPNTVLVAPAGRVTDGPSVPWIFRGICPPSRFYYSGVMHDYIRGHFTTGNATTDGFLRDMANAEGMDALRSYLIYVGVRVGTYTGYQCKTPDPVATCKTFAEMRDVPFQEVWFDINNFEMRYRTE